MLFWLFSAWKCPSLLPVLSPFQQLRAQRKRNLSNHAVRALKQSKLEMLGKDITLKCKDCTIGRHHCRHCYDSAKGLQLDSINIEMKLCFFTASLKKERKIAQTWSRHTKNVWDRLDSRFRLIAEIRLWLVSMRGETIHIRITHLLICVENKTKWINCCWHF